MKRGNLAPAVQKSIAYDGAACMSCAAPGFVQYDDCRKRVANQPARDMRGHQRMLDKTLNDTSSTRPLEQSVRVGLQARDGTSICCSQQKTLGIGYCRRPKVRDAKNSANESLGCISRFQLVI